MDEFRVDFLGIGAPRAGTTWLWNVLRHHPGIWMPPRKELHYFDRSLKYRSPSHLADERFARRMFGSRSSSREFRVVFVKDLFRAVFIQHNWADFRWTLRYLFGTVSDDWYLSLFETGTDAVRGEITPAYCLLNLEDVQHIKKLFPDLKILYLLRNPIERAWSQIRLKWTRGKFNSINRPEKVIAAAEKVSHSRRGDYIATISTWQSCFSKEQFFIGFYEDVVQNPRQLSQSIFEFLGVDSTTNLPDELLRGRVNASKPRDMPDEVARILAKSYQPEVEALNRMIGGQTGKWLADIEQMPMQ